MLTTQIIFSFFKLQIQITIEISQKNVFLDKEGRHLKAYRKIFKLYKPSYFIFTSFLYIPQASIYPHPTVQMKAYRRLNLLLVPSTSHCLDEGAS